MKNAYTVQTKLNPILDLPRIMNILNSTLRFGFYLYFLLFIMIFIFAIAGRQYMGAVLQVPEFASFGLSMVSRGRGRHRRCCWRRLRYPTHACALQWHSWQCLRWSLATDGTTCCLLVRQKEDILMRYVSVREPSQACLCRLMILHSLFLSPSDLLRHVAYHLKVVHLVIHHGTSLPYFDACIHLVLPHDCVSIMHRLWSFTMSI